MLSNRSIGDILVARGVLTSDQVQQILERQKHRRHPFGKLAREMFGISERELWKAWAAQVVDQLPEVDLPLHPIDTVAIKCLRARDAWSCQLLPLQCSEGVVTFATSRARLADAVAFVNERFSEAAEFVLADPRQLDQALITHYDTEAKRTEALTAASFENRRQRDRF